MSDQTVCSRIWSPVNSLAHFFEFKLLKIASTASEAYKYSSSASIWGIDQNNWDNSYQVNPLTLQNPKIPCHVTILPLGEILPLELFCENTSKIPETWFSTSRMPFLRKKSRVHGLYQPFYTQYSWLFKVFFVFSRKGVWMFMTILV